MAGHDIIAIGASAGGVQALIELVRGLPSDLPASLFIAIHTAPESSGFLPHILNRSGPLRAEYAVHNQPIEHGRIYVAPPDHHLLLKHNQVCVYRGPKENGFRPAIDPLFRTAAAAYGARTIGVILSGGLDDGTMGLIQIKEAGGVAVVQDPDEAPFPSMPASAVQNAEVDYVLPIVQIPGVLAELARQPVAQGAKAMAGAKRQIHDVAEKGTNALETGELPYPPSKFTCPECGGALWELKGGKMMRYRCHVGHGFTAESLLNEQANGVEAALWTALRALEENAALRRRMAERASHGHYNAIVRTYMQQAEEVESRAAVIRKVLVNDAVKPRHKQARPGHAAPKDRPGKSARNASSVRKSSPNGANR